MHEHLNRDELKYTICKENTAQWLEMPQKCLMYLSDGIQREGK
jgi:hypothetical protein